MGKTIRIVAVVLSLAIALTMGSSKIEASGSSVDLEVLTIKYKALFGGSNYDYFYDAVEDKDGNIIAVGSTDSSTTGDLGGDTPKGLTDCLVVKFDSKLNVLDRKTYGGSSYEELVSVIIDSDGNFVTVGHVSSSNDGDFVGHTTISGSVDGLVIKFDANLNLLAIDTYGGSGTDDFYGVTVYKDGYAVVGRVFAMQVPMGDLVSIPQPFNDRPDAFIAIYDKNLNFQKGKAIGGSDDDIFYKVEAVGNKLVAVGDAAERDGDFAAFVSDGTIGGLITVFDENLNVLKMDIFNGNGGDFFRNVIIDKSGNIIVAGYTSSDNDGDLVGLFNSGYEDFLIVKYDINLNVLNKMVFGGAGIEAAFSIAENEEIGYTISGIGTSPILGKSTNGNEDVLALLVDKDFNVVDYVFYGGSQSDSGMCGLVTKDGNRLFCGMTNSDNDGSLTGAPNSGGDDAFVMLENKDKYLLKSTIDEKTVLLNTTINDNDLLKLFGITATKNNQGEMPKVVVTHNIDVTKEGSYKVTFTYQTGYGDIKLETVLIVKASVPTIVLNKPHVKVKINEFSISSTYVETFKAVANDKVDGDLTSVIVVDSSKVDKTKVGQYSVTFSVTNSFGKSASTTGILEIVDDADDDTNVGNDPDIDDPDKDEPEKDKETPDTGDNNLTITLMLMVVVSSLVITRRKLS